MILSIEDDDDEINYRRNHCQQLKSTTSSERTHSYGSDV